ncbi:MAG: PspC domain-containing protein [Fibrobacterota bacterium]
MKRLYRSEKDAMVSGICGGLGGYFNIDPTLIRIGVVILAFSGVGTVPVIMGYLLGTFLIPVHPGDSQ